MADVTFIVPVAPDHEALLERTLASIAAQTVPVKQIVIRDVGRRGAGWARNQGIQQCTTRFLAFLDADDEVLPEFTERTVNTYQSGRFVYTDWYDLDAVTLASECPWTANTRNVITTLVATRDAREIRGFDETLTGMEDTHFYLKLLSSGVCGLHVREPLFRYHPGGARSKAFYNTPAYHAAVQRFNAEFGGRPMAECGGCGGSPYANPQVDLLPIGEQQAGDVLALALWSGNRQERGRATGRLYPRTSSNGGGLWMSPLDIDAAPHLFSRKLEPIQQKAAPKSPTTDDFAAFANYAMQSMLGGVKPAPEVAPTVYGVPGKVQPNVDNLLRLYQQAQ